jgi:hypothetical protein
MGHVKRRTVDKVSRRLRTPIEAKLMDKPRLNERVALKSPNERPDYEHMLFAKSKI